MVFSKKKNMPPTSENSNVHIVFLFWAAVRNGFDFFFRFGLFVIIPDIVKMFIFVVVFIPILKA